MLRETAPRQSLCADIDGFSLHAAVRVEAHDRKRLEQLFRYITRPALSDERVQLNGAGQVKLLPKSHWRDGTTHLMMVPLEFMQRPHSKTASRKSHSLAQCQQWDASGCSPSRCGRQQTLHG